MECCLYDENKINNRKDFLPNRHEINKIISIHNSKRLLQTKIVRLEEQEAPHLISMETGDQTQPPYKCHSDHQQPGSSQLTNSSSIVDKSKTWFINIIVCI